MKLLFYKIYAFHSGHSNVLLPFDFYIRVDMKLYLSRHQFLFSSFQFDIIIEMKNGIEIDRLKD